MTATEVVIGTNQPLSGPAAFWGVPVTGGMDAWIKFINDRVVTALGIIRGL